MFWGWHAIGVGYLRPMSDVSALSAKEKESLRLLLKGHDAKSAALRLGLSVHSYNERLRTARRKLSVTSSKEAARILSSAEEQRPKKLGPKDLRDDVLSSGMQRPRTSTAGPAARPLRWQSVGAIGGLSMLFILTALATTMQPASDDEAQRAAEKRAAAQAEKMAAQSAELEQKAAEIDRAAQALLDERRIAALDSQAARLEQQAARLEEQAIALEKAAEKRARDDQS